MNGLTLVALIVLAIGGVVAYRAGARSARRFRRVASDAALPIHPAQAPQQVVAAATASERETVHEDSIAPERFRIMLSYEVEANELRRALAAQRERYDAALADARSQTLRYRQLVIDTEDNAPPPLLDSPTAPDDLKLIVGIGPVLERMLQQLGIASYRQIARWTERDIDEFDARLAEFPGRIRRDDWVKQARALHHSKFGSSATTKERG